MDDLEPGQLDSMDPLERLRFFARLGAQEARAAARLAAAQAEMKAAALEIGAHLFGLRDGDLVWEGNPVECLMAERPVTAEDGQEEVDCDDDLGPWPVNVEVGLLSRAREQKFVLDDLLSRHQEEVEEAGGLLAVTPAQLPSGEWFAVMTAVDTTKATSMTFVFGIDDKA
jgi:hypothetical protein